jgi:hypothetical protein
MTDFKHIIEPERMGLWVAVTFVVALLALVAALVAIQRNAELAVVTQSEVMMLNKKIEGGSSSAPAAESAPAEATQ